MTDTKEAKYWQAKLDDLQRMQLDTVRNTAAKWQATIATLLGIFGVVSFVNGANSVEELSPRAATVAKPAVVLAVLLALASVLAATYAAQGILRRRSQPTWAWLEEQSRIHATKALRALQASQVMALLAVALVVLGSIAVLIASEPKTAPPAPRLLVRLSDGTVRCGAVSTDVGGMTHLAVVNGPSTELNKTVEVIATVSNCGKPRA